MMTQSEVERLKVGDVVGYGRNWGGTFSPSLDTVSLVTSTSIRLKGGKRFTLRGYEWGKGNHGARLYAADTMARIARTSTTIQGEVTE